MRFDKELLFGMAFVIAVPAVAIGGSPAHALPATTGVTNPDAAQEAAKQAFEAMPEADRKAVQDGLIWTGDYKGIADGRFGKGTRDAIAAFALRSKLPGDGTLDDKGRAMLAAAAQRAKAAVGFSIIADEKAGVRIGVPLKLLQKASATNDGVRHASTDGKAALQTMLVPESEATLEQKFDALRAETAQRKVTYKVLRPDFFVVVGEAAGAIFYTRMARSDRAGTPVLAGYTLTYPAAAKATYDVIAIAVANSFAPLAAAPQVAAPPPASGERSSAEPAPAKPYLLANGVLVAPDLVLTSLPDKPCRSLEIAGHAAKITQQAKANGLALVEAANLPGSSVALRAGDLPPDLPVVVLAYAARERVAAKDMPATKAAAASKDLTAGRDLARDRADAEDLVAAPGQLRSTPSGLRVLTAAQGVSSGSVVLDRSGALVGLVAADAAPEKRVGDVVPTAPRPMISASALGEFLGARRPKEAGRPAAPAAGLSLGDIIAAQRAALVPIYCVP